ncbi:MAG: hypothetical protein E7G07_04675 [Flavonifractor plautii]|nr:hypothetical protein [Flavonifractor plautii]
MDNKPIPELSTMLREMDRRLPLARKIYHEIGLPWEYIAPVFFSSKSGFTEAKRYTSSLPDVNPAELIQRYDEAITNYAGDRLTKRPGPSSKVKELWKEKRPVYLAALEQKRSLDSLTLTEDELAQENDWLQWQEAVKRLTVLEKVRPAFVALEKGQALKLAYHYEGYAALGYLPFLGCIAIMTETAQWELKEHMDAMTTTTAENLALLVRNAGAISHCVAIRYKNGSEERGGMATAWKKFEAQAQEHGYFDLLTVAVLLLSFQIGDIESHELDMVMTYAFCLTSEQRRYVLEMAKGMLTAGNLREPHKAAELAELFMADDMEQCMEGLLGLTR